MSAVELDIKQIEQLQQLGFGDVALTFRDIRNDGGLVQPADCSSPSTNFGDYGVWRVHDYLSERRRDVSRVYHYSYSDLDIVFSRLHV